MKVYVLPGHDRAVANGVDQFGLPLSVVLCVELPGKVEIIPADDRILDQPPTALGDPLVLRALSRIAITPLRPICTIDSKIMA